MTIITSHSKQTIVQVYHADKLASDLLLSMDFCPNFHGKHDIIWWILWRIFCWMENWLRESRNWKWIEGYSTDEKWHQQQNHCAPSANECLLFFYVQFFSATFQLVTNWKKKLNFASNENWVYEKSGKKQLIELVSTAILMELQRRRKNNFV